MRQAILVFLSIIILTQCTEPAIEASSAEMLIGSWVNADKEITIEFDKNSNYTLNFNSQTSFSCPYTLADDSESNLLYLKMDEVTYQCAYQLIGSDQLKLTRINPPQTFDTDNLISFFKRVH